MTVGHRAATGAAGAARPAEPLAEPLAELERLADAAMDERARGYVSTGAGDEVSLREAGWEHLRFAPYTCVDVSRPDTRTELVGHRLDHPVLVAPTGCHRLVHAEGETASARGAAGTVYCLSEYTTTPMEEVARAAAGPWWVQLNGSVDDAFTRERLEAAAAHGATAAVVTVDTPVAGLRERQGWDGVSLPEGLAFGVLDRAPYPVRSPAEPHGVHRPALDARLTWPRLAALCASTELPVLVKGVLRGDDAVRCAEAGADAVIVSNHGARNLDSVVRTSDALPRVVAALDGRIPVLVDGAIRRGGDVVKALALGARAVLVGRPVLWGLAVDGADGVRRMLQRLRYELEMTMALCGTPRLADIDAGLLA